MMLGHVMRSLDDASDEAVLALVGDLVLFARLRSAASALGQPATAYAREAIGRFLHGATEEEWTTAIGRMQDDPAPGDRLIGLAIEQQLRSSEERRVGEGCVRTGRSGWAPAQ